MIIVLNDKTLVSPLPDMPAGPVMLVITANMACHEPLHPFVKALSHFRLNKHMEVVRHETPGQYSDRMLCAGSLHQVNERPIVAFLVKDLLSAVTSVGEVVATIVR